MKWKVKVWVYPSQQVSTWQGANGDKELFSFKAKDSFMVVKQKVENVTCLVFQASKKRWVSPQLLRNGQTAYACIYTQTPSEARDIDWNLSVSKFNLEIK